MVATASGQLAIDETVVENKPLEDLLEARQRSRDDLAMARADFREAHTQAEAAVTEAFGEIDGETVYRVGRFRIEKKVTPARTVSFETEQKERLAIGLAEGESEPVE
jgi:hypothetical protein